MICYDTDDRDNKQMSCDVACVGVMVADVLANGVDNSLFDRDMTRVSMVKFATGGDAFNQAFNISSMGYRVKMLGKVGTDSIGNFLVSEAERKGIDTTNIVRDPEHQTSVTIVLIGENGQRNFIGCKFGTNSFLSKTDINLDAFDGAKIVSLGSLYGSLSFTGAETAPIMEEAHNRGCITVADMMHAERGSLEDASLVIKHLDYFIPSEKEALLLTGKEDVEEAAEALLAAGAKNIVIKLGEKGCYVKNHEISEYIPAFKTDVVDTTGAGDAFVSGFITGIIDGAGITDCAVRGCAAGSIAVRDVGATGAITSKSQVLDVIYV